QWLTYGRHSTQLAAGRCRTAIVQFLRSRRILDEFVLVVSNIAADAKRKILVDILPPGSGEFNAAVTQIADVLIQLLRGIAECSAEQHREDIIERAAIFIIAARSILSSLCCSAEHSAIPRSSWTRTSAICVTAALNSPLPGGRISTRIFRLASAAMLLTTRTNSSRIRRDRRNCTMAVRHLPAASWVL